VGVVIVNFGDRGRVLRCLRGLADSTWPADRLRVVVVDNEGDADLPRRATAVLPSVQVLKTAENLGYPAACNRGIEALPECDYLALLNNDTVPTPGWLEPLVEALSEAGIGAATPKVRLAHRYHRVELRTRTPRRAGDPRALGVKLHGARIGGTDRTEQLLLDAGFWGWEHTPSGARFNWTTDTAVCHVPDLDEPDGGGTLHLQLSSDRPTRVTVTVDGEVTVLDVDDRVRIFELWTSAAVPVINNVGACLLPDGRAFDRGFLEPDDGRYDETDEVFAWSATAV
jgi:glycosyltransferase involved in cell wall biosynthesis